ncbi:MAG: DUF4910 domain-containing protein, partial [bacterium]|nr:DUF4910 domain-containing protein [bacterium]
LKFQAPEYREYHFLRDRGSDERQYCSPGINLPMVSIMRSKYGTYPEYHTSLDDLSVVTTQGLQRSFDLHLECIQSLETNHIYRSTIVGDPQLSRRGLDMQLGGGKNPSAARIMIQNLMTCFDGTLDLIQVADELNVYTKDLLPIVDVLVKQKLVEIVE